ncbi:uncharacterized protein LOC132057797 [Lycium ferocissimum]|uniref:uncharacterized protein LOC132057797 n=1 Tax=Lycium ferocissimum TaxID=112874 RepID=UPI002815DBC4|nr:uncharacterized protein LOC132057797 [Lycium ferocissimum]
MTLPSAYGSISVIDLIDVIDRAVEIKMEEKCLGEALVAILVNFDVDDMEGYMETINSLEDSSPSVEHQRRLNPPIQVVVKKEIIKWLDTGVVYPITDSKWINIALEGQEMMNFTCPYGNFTFNRMPFGLCNTPATFQRCMMSIFLDMVEDFLEVFMDDFSTEGIVLDHKISEKGIEDDEAKTDVIVKLPPPISAFDELKECLTSALIIVSPDWSLPFELMCDASGFPIGVILGHRHNKIMHPIYYASKMLSGAQMNYTVTKQELLAIVYAFEKFRAYLLGSKVVVYMRSCCIEVSDGEEGGETAVDWMEPIVARIQFCGERSKEVRKLGCRPSLTVEEDGGPSEELDIDDAFPDERVLAVSSHCIPESEVMEMLKACHDSPVGGHHSGTWTAAKVLEYGYYWPTLIHDANLLA